MALSALDDNTTVPDEEALRLVLRRTLILWNMLKADLSKEFEPLTEQWNYSGVGHGWSLRLIHKKRTIVYMIPQHGFFLAGLVLGERAFRAAHKEVLPSSIIRLIDAAPRYGEGRGFRIEIRKKGDVEAVRKLASMKMAN